MLLFTELAIYTFVILLSSKAVHVWKYTYACKCHICLPISAHGLLRMINDFNFVCKFTYVNVLHWIVGLYYS